MAILGTSCYANDENTHLNRSRTDDFHQVEGAIYDKFIQFREFGEIDDKNTKCSYMRLTDRDLNRKSAMFCICSFLSLRGEIIANELRVR